jgi:DNA-directed RNA polymerase subunit RPC12/RpoP
MTNENCLRGIRCPNCGNQDRFLIVAAILAEVTDDGADIAKHSDVEWDDDSHTRCPECNQDGPLATFHANQEE